MHFQPKIVESSTIFTFLTQNAYIFLFPRKLHSNNTDFIDVFGIIAKIVLFISYFLVLNT